jgi:hypothetical protein
MWIHRKFSRLFVLSLALIGAGCGLSSSDDDAEQAPLQSLSEKKDKVATEQGEKPAQGHLIASEELARTSLERDGIVTARQGRLFVHAHNRSLEWVLKEISRQSGVTIMRAAGGANSTLTIQLEEMPLDQGLRQILKGHDIFFFYGAEESKEDGGTTPVTVPLKTVWVYPKGEGLRMTSTLPDPGAGTAEGIKTRMANASPAERAQWVESLIEQRREGNLEAVHLALNDRSDEVRERTLHAALNSGTALPAAWLENLALNDFSPMVRFLAVGAIVNHSGDSLVVTPNARTVAQLALKDPSLNVREQARQVLEQMDQPFQPSNQQEDPGIE